MDGTMLKIVVNSDSPSELFYYLIRVLDKMKVVSWRDPSFGKLQYELGRKKSDYLTRLIKEVDGID